MGTSTPFTSTSMSPKSLSSRSAAERVPSARMSPMPSRRPILCSRAIMASPFPQVRLGQEPLLEGLHREGDGIAGRDGVQAVIVAQLVALRDNLDLRALAHA